MHELSWTVMIAKKQIKFCWRFNVFLGFRRYLHHFARGLPQYLAVTFLRWKRGVWGGRGLLEVERSRKTSRHEVKLLERSETELKRIVKRVRKSNTWNPQTSLPKQNTIKCFLRFFLLKQFYKNESLWKFMSHPAPSSRGGVFLNPFRDCLVAPQLPSINRRHATTLRWSGVASHIAWIRNGFGGRVPFHETLIGL